MPDPGFGVSALKPYLRIQAIGVHVSDLDRSRTFYGDVLGFVIIQPPSQPTDRRLVFVAPPDGAAVLVLLESDLANGRGGAPDVAFVTDDLDERYREWSQRGVHFTQPPRSVPWSARQAIYVLGSIPRRLIFLPDQQLTQEARFAARANLRVAE
jgi:catechol 2,3-dioxygenase-like lactoylglutathione lyase family enzyme